MDPETPRARVLVVDDDGAFLTSLCELCRLEGFAATPARTLSEAAAVVASQGTDAVLLDVGLPDGDGFAFLRDLRARPETESLPVIIVTGDDEPGWIRRAFLAGASDYLRKPIPPGDLAPRLDAALRRGREARARELDDRLFAGTTAHDFNNILGVILGFAEASLRGPASVSPEVRRNLEEIRRATGQASELAQQLLAFSRRHAAASLSALTVDSVVARSEGLLRRLAGSRIELVTRLDAAHLEVLGDASKLEQVLMNLVVNARDAVSEGGEVRLETSEVRRGSERFVALRVRDTGVGMSESVKARIFEPFFTTKAGSGTGLGLPLVRAIVEQHRGEIAVESTPGEQTTFTVLLPVVKT